MPSTSFRSLHYTHLSQTQSAEIQHSPPPPTTTAAQAQARTSAAECGWRQTDTLMVSRQIHLCVSQHHTIPSLNLLLSDFFMSFLLPSNL